MAMIFARTYAIKRTQLSGSIKAKKNIYIQTPYFVPDDAILDSLRTLAISGVDVRVMIPNMPDHPFVYWVTFSYIGELLGAGIR